MDCFTLPKQVSRPASRFSVSPDSVGCRDDLLRGPCVSVSNGNARFSERSIFSAFTKQRGRLVVIADCKAYFGTSPPSVMKVSVTLNC